MKLSPTSIAFLTLLASSSVLAIPGLVIPGILSLELGEGNGLKINVLGGLVNAHIGGHGPGAAKTLNLGAAIATPTH